MKIQSKIDNEVFKPIEITVVIESQEEFDALLNMTTYDIDIPAKVAGGWLDDDTDDVANPEVYDIIQAFLTKFRQRLNIYDPENYTDE